MDVSKVRRALLAIGFVAAISCAGMLLLSMERNRSRPVTEPAASASDAAEAAGTLLVHVKGAVSAEGVYELPENTRVRDAVEAAGGLSESADLTNVNLAARLSDGDELYIPPVGDRSGKPVLSSRSGRSDSSGESGDSSAQAGTGVKININTASVSELDALPGIGEKTAQKIVAYRESQPFEVIEDIMNVPTIGEAKFQQIQDLITTGN